MGPYDGDGGPPGLKYPLVCGTLHSPTNYKKLKLMEGNNANEFRLHIPRDKRRCPPISVISYGNILKML